MFDPLFSILFLLAVATPITAIVFWLSRKNLTLGSAVWMAFIVPFSALLGFFGCVMVLTNTEMLFWDETLPMLRLGICFASGILLALFMGWIFWRTSHRRA